MLLYFTVLLCFALLDFGAVQPQAWLALVLLWLVGFLVLIARRVVKSLPVTTELVAFSLGCVSLLTAGEKLGVAVLAGCWVWVAGRRDPVRALWLLNALIVVGILEALLGFIQFFASPGWIFGYIGPSRSSGTFINKNHYAGMLGLLVPLCLGCVYIGMRRFGDLAKSYVYLLLGAFMGIALVFSVSRSGVFSFLVTLMALVILIAVKDAQARMATGLGLAMLGLVVAGALWIGLDVVVERYANLVKEDGLMDDGRLFVFKDTLRMIQAMPMGAGVGNYSDVFRRFQTFRPNYLFDHAHNDYLEIAAEFGWPVALVLWGGIIAAWIRIVRAFFMARAPERSGILLACSGAVLGILIHSLTDFNLQIPSNAMLFCGLLGLGIASSSSVSRGDKPLSEL